MSGAGFWQLIDRHDRRHTTKGAGLDSSCSFLSCSVPDLAVRDRRGWGDPSSVQKALAARTGRIFRYRSRRPGPGLASGIAKCHPTARGVAPAGRVRGLPPMVPAAAGAVSRLQGGLA